MFIHYTAQNLFFAELLNKLVYPSDFFYNALLLLNPLLIWMIGKRFFKAPTDLIPPIIYIISPWGWYLGLAHCTYLYLFFLILVIIYGIVYSNNLPIILASLMVMYSSSLFLILIPFSFTVLAVTKIIKIKKFILLISSILLLILPLFFLINSNRSGFRDNLKASTKFFSDPAIINTANRYQGNAEVSGLKYLSRISENKYIFLSESLLLKYLTNLSPIAFFSPEYKLLGFSFSPPILLGFIVPFIYGGYILIKERKFRKILIVSTILVIPSLVANDIVSPNRLILFFPVVIFVITFGITRLFEIRKQKTAKMFLILFIILVLVQSLIILNDLASREKGRYQAYFGNKLEIEEP